MDDQNPYFTSSEDEELNPKEYRDIAEGKNLNNSFVGPYPENWDHLHIDKGPNPQFLVFKEPQIQNLNSHRSQKTKSPKQKDSAYLGFQQPK